MMEDIEIKSEFNEIDVQLCRACLSVGRKLLPLGDYAEIYRKIIPQGQRCSSDEQLCWECHCLLYRVARFQVRAQRANEILITGQSFVYGTLSDLTTVILNDTRTHIYVNAQPNKPKDKQTEPEATTDCEDHSDGDDFGADKYDTTATETKHPDDVKTEKEPQVVQGLKNSNISEAAEATVAKKAKTNRWAQQRALLNKKPKFKIVSTNSNEIFRRFTINIGELMEYMETERDSVSFASMKHKCNSCVLGFRDDSGLSRHNKEYHDKDIGPYVCDICSSRSADKHLLIEHIRAHRYKYECTLCGFCCYRKRHTSSHAQTRHRHMFQCLTCALKFGSRREFFKHFKEWHEKFICDHCGISFKMRYCIKEHIRKQHSPFECKQCQKRFARYNGLWLHNKVRHGPPAPAAYCVECDKRYVDVYRYRWHLANSARHRPRDRVRIPCPGCDKVFSKNIYMKDHYNLVHLKYYKYRCEDCDKNFIRNADLVKHKRRVHEGILPPKNKICYVCGKGFTTNKILTNHLRTHTGERPFACSSCPARFAQRAALLGHERALHAAHDKLARAARHAVMS